jgi:hypothetical protein
MLFPEFRPGWPELISNPRTGLWPCDCCDLQRQVPPLFGAGKQPLHRGGDAEQAMVVAVPRDKHQSDRQSTFTRARAEKWRIGRRNLPNLYCAQAAWR